MSNLDPSFTVGRQLAYGLKASTTLSDADVEQRIIDLLTRVGITDPDRVMGLYPHEISGGMAQRVLICGAVAADPDIIIADEPTTALDVTVQAEVLELLRELSEERGLAMLLVTHNLGVVADLCDTVSVMKDGLIVEHAGVEEIFEVAPAGLHPRTAAVIPPRRTVGGIVTTPAPDPAHDSQHRADPAGQRPRGHLPRPPGQADHLSSKASPSTCQPARHSAWSASPAPGRPPSAAPSSAWRRSPAAPSPSAARPSATSPARCAASSPPTSRSSSRTRTPR